MNRSYLDMHGLVFETKPCMSKYIYIIYIYIYISAHVYLCIVHVHVHTKYMHLYMYNVELCNDKTVAIKRTACNSYMYMYMHTCMISMHHVHVPCARPTLAVASLSLELAVLAFPCRLHSCAHCLSHLALQLSQLELQELTLG